MEAPSPSTRDQPAPAPGTPGGPGGQASPRLTLGPVILPPEQGLPPTLFLKALPVPLYHTVPPGGFQPRAPLVTGSLEGASVPFILSPLLQPEGPSPTQVSKPAPPALTVNIVGTLPVLSPGVGPTLVNPGRLKNAGKHLCPHCGRDCLKPSVLEKHIRSHTGERPFPCSTCGIAFKTQSNLYKHRRTQTHLNNSRLSSESEGSGSSLLEDGDRPGETASVESRGMEGAPERALSPGAAKNREGKVGSAALSHREASVDQTQTVSPEFSLASPQPRRKLPEPKPCSLQRQQETCSEKPWDAKALEGQLRKCESTDSGYLSRSDSVEQPPVTSSPLHSLSEHSAESEGEGGPSCDSASSKAEPGASGSSLEIEKKKLEERIAQLISHNQAVVDDPQLDNVRPRKTVLSKQGSIDLPMPYTYKDSFHFDIRAQEPTRRRVALGPACSTFTPQEKARPVFFHSVPTQLSTTVECVPVTRSNSLPFVEGSKLRPEPQDPQDTVPRMQKALSPRLTPGKLGCRQGLTLAGIPSGHPRALVRQAAVEDLPCTPTGDPSTVAEDLDGKRAGVQQGVACKGRVSKKCSQRKQKMFSQEKWQVYGNESFRRIYQKTKSSHQGGQQHREVKQGQGTELDLSSQEEVTGGEGAGLSQDNRIPILGHSTAGAEPGSWGSHPSLEDSLEAEPPKQLKVVARAKSSPTLGSTDGLFVSCKSPLLSSSGELDLGCQPPTVSEPHQGGDSEAPETVLPDPSGEAIKESSPEAQTSLRGSSGGSVAPQTAENKLPSERKRPKVEGLHHHEQSGPLEAETSASSVQADPRPLQKQDVDPEEALGSSTESILHVTTVLESSDAASAASTVTLKWPGLGDKDSPLPSVPGTPGLHSLLPAQPWDPSVPSALSGGFFAPRYLLRLPQGENPLPLVAPGPWKGPDSLCTNAQSAEKALLVGSELGVLRPPGAFSGPGEAGSSPEASGGSRSRAGREEAQMGREKRRNNSSIPVAEHSPGPSSGTVQEIASILSAHTCDTHAAQDVVSETHATHCLCTDSPPARARTYGNLSSPRTSSQKLGTPPKNVLEGPSSETKEGLPACFYSQAPCFLTSLAQPQGISLNQQKLALSHLLGTPRSCEAPSSFPSLKAEPQLTWCCLGRSLPLTAEQQKAAPGHLPDGTFQGESNRALSQTSGSGGKNKISPGGEGPMQAPEVTPARPWNWEKTEREGEEVSGKGERKLKTLSL